MTMMLPPPTWLLPLLLYYTSNHVIVVTTATSSCHVCPNEKNSLDGNSLLNTHFSKHTLVYCCMILTITQEHLGIPTRTSRPDQLPKPSYTNIDLKTVPIIVDPNPNMPKVQGMAHQLCLRYVQDKNKTHMVEVHLLLLYLLLLWQVQHNFQRDVWKDFHPHWPPLLKIGDEHVKYLQCSMPSLKFQMPLS